MTSEANKKAYAKWMSNPENRKKHNEWCYRKKREARRKAFEKHRDHIVSISNDREAVLDYLLNNFNLKVRG